MSRGAAFKATSISAKVTERAQAAASRVRGAVKRGCSFVAGALVRMADGSLTPIEDLLPGDLNLAGDPNTGETSPELVITPLVSTGDKRLIALRFDGDVEAVVATDNHPYWVQDQGWVAAGDLLVGDTTVASDGSERVLVQIGDLGVFANQTVHNLHVAGQHTYYVTADEQQADQLVHNARACPIGGVYAIKSDSGRVIRTGRTNDLARRASEHRRMYPEGAHFEVLYRTNNRATQRGLEQIVHQRYRPILNSRLSDLPLQPEAFLLHEDGQQLPQGDQVVNGWC